MSFAAAKAAFGGQDAIDKEQVTFKYLIYDLAAEYWHEPYVEKILSGMDKKQLLYWLSYREIRAGIEKKRMDESKAEAASKTKRR